MGRSKVYTTGFIFDTTATLSGDAVHLADQAEYLITYLNEDYTQTVIGRNKRTMSDHGPYPSIPTMIHQDRR